MSSSIQEEFVKICGGDESGNNLIELPLEDNNSLMLATLQGQFTNATGLKYQVRSSGAWRGVKICGNALFPPQAGWGDTVYEITLAKKDIDMERKKETVKELESQVNEKLRKVSQLIQETTGKSSMSTTQRHTETIVKNNFKRPDGETISECLGVPQKKLKGYTDRPNCENVSDNVEEQFNQTPKGEVKELSRNKLRSKLYNKLLKDRKKLPRKLKKELYSLTCKEEPNVDMSISSSKEESKKLYRVTPCVYFMEGYCGTEVCTFLHPGVHPTPTVESLIKIPVPKGVGEKKSCIFFMKGDCKNENCTFLHPGIHPEPTPNMEESSLNMEECEGVGDKPYTYDIYIDSYTQPNCETHDLMVVNLTANCTKEDLLLYFTGACGEVEFIEIKCHNNSSNNTNSHKSKYYGFIKFKTLKGEKFALATSPHKIFGNVVSIMETEKCKIFQFAVKYRIDDLTKDTVEEHFSRFGEVMFIGEMGRTYFKMVMKFANRIEYHRVQKATHMVKVKGKYRIDDTMLVLSKLKSKFRNGGSPKVGSFTPPNKLSKTQLKKQAIVESRKQIEKLRKYGFNRLDAVPSSRPIRPFVPVNARPLLPVNVRPFAPVNVRPFAPVNVRPFAPVNVRPLLPVNPRPFAPVNVCTHVRTLQPAPQILSMPNRLVSPIASTSYHNQASTNQGYKDERYLKVFQGVCKMLNVKDTSYQKQQGSSSTGNQNLEDYYQMEDQLPNGGNMKSDYQDTSREDSSDYQDTSRGSKRIYPTKRLASKYK